MSTRYDCNDPAQREAGIEAAVEALRDGGLVVMPTDTVYGIGADAFTPRAVSMLLAAKGRGRNMPPPVLVGTVRAANALVEGLGAFGQDLIDEFWPGPLTLVFRAAPTLQWDLGDTMGTVAVRMPLHPVALEVLKLAGPTAVSSANLTGSPAATTAADAQAQLGASVSVYLDGGPCASDVPSTILDLTGAIPRVLRAGAISVDRLRKVAAIIDDTPLAESVGVKPAEPHPLGGTPQPPPAVDDETPVSAPEADAPVSPPEADAPVSPPEADAAVSPPEADAAVSPPEADAPVSPPEADSSAPPAAAGTSGSSRGAGTSRSSRAAGTSRSSRSAGASTSSRATGTSRSSRSAGAAKSSQANGTSEPSQATGTSRSARAAGTARPSRAKSSQVDDASESSQAADTSRPPRSADTSKPSRAAGARKASPATDTPHPPSKAG
jgi:L-threonylcarbamoyladenylate synthase